MPAKPVFVGQSAASEVPVSGGSIFGSIANLPNSIGGLFGGQGGSNSPSAPTPGGQPVSPNVGKQGQTGTAPQQQASPIFGADTGTDIGGMGSTGSAAGGTSSDMLKQLLTMLGL